MAKKTQAGTIIRDVYKTMHQAAMDTLYNASTDLQSNYRDVVRSWKNKPDFNDQFLVTKARIEVTIKPKGQKKVLAIFNYVDQGTRGPYLIPKFLVPGGKMLVFRGGYSAMTQPIARYNVGTGSSFGSWIKKRQVLHPGIKARKFMQTFLEELRPSLDMRLQQELTRQLV